MSSTSSFHGTRIESKESRSLACSQSWAGLGDSHHLYPLPEKELQFQWYHICTHIKRILSVLTTEKIHHSHQYHSHDLHRKAVSCAPCRILLVAGEQALVFHKGQVLTCWKYLFTHLFFNMYCCKIRCSQVLCWTSRIQRWLVIFQPYSLSWVIRWGINDAQHVWAVIEVWGLLQSQRRRVGLTQLKLGLIEYLKSE